jgi:hypothetical protein
MRARNRPWGLGCERWGHAGLTRRREQRKRCIGRYPSSFSGPGGFHARVQRSPHQRIRIANQASHAIVHRCLRHPTRERRGNEGI